MLGVGAYGRNLKVKAILDRGACYGNHNPMVTYSMYQDIQRVPPFGLTRMAMNYKNIAELEPAQSLSSEHEHRLWLSTERKQMV
jgi:hypothetical protein